MNGALFKNATLSVHVYMVSSYMFPVFPLILIYRHDHPRQTTHATVHHRPLVVKLPTAAVRAPEPLDGFAHDSSQSNSSIGALSQYPAPGGEVAFPGGEVAFPKDVALLPVAPSAVASAPAGGSPGAAGDGAATRT